MSVPADVSVVESSLVRAVPSRWRSRAEQLRVDLRMLLEGARGETPAPYFQRSGSRFDAWPTSSGDTGLHGRKVRVSAVDRPTADAVTLTLRDVKLRPTHVVPGQFFTFEVEVEGKRLRRAYSACHDCRGTDTFSVTIKRVDGGVVSNYFNDRAAVGDELEVFGPSGSFVAAPRPEADIAPRRLLLVAGGSGITPMMAITRTLLESDPEVRIALIYGNRSRRDVIFFDELEQLAERHAERLSVQHVLERDEAGQPAQGRLAPEVLGGRIEAVRDADPSFSPESVHAYVCGPEPMMDGARDVLRDWGVSGDRLHEERFSAPQRRVNGGAADTGPQMVRATLDGVEYEYATQAGETLLEAGLRAGLELPYSCAMGGCAACRVALREGEVDQEEPSCLSSAERESGYVLACVSRPRTACSFEVSR